jgi:hypothetical protein
VPLQSGLCDSLHLQGQIRLSACSTAEFPSLFGTQHETPSRIRESAGMVSHNVYGGFRLVVVWGPLGYLMSTTRLRNWPQACVT